MEPGRAGTLIYDGHCAFCRRWAARLDRLAGGRIQLLSCHDPGVPARFGLRREDCEASIQLILPGGTIRAGAEAAFHAVSVRPALCWVRWLYGIPGIGRLSEQVYGWVARRRHRL